MSTLIRTISSAARIQCRSMSYQNKPREFKVVLDNETLYIDKTLAEALGWKPEQDVNGVPLILSGWEPQYFNITRSGSDSDLLARSTVESSRNPRVKQVLEYLRDQ
ncbi:hypothetical protein ABKN59_004041 [Abortiporus biennis]